ncbi:predicted protein [Nematostella vectensis]|uniref:Uncharacterized protein n=1 Tax=Nematostella vectensis TaxID=45351 RepID=A7SSM7_NEMVE|nr:predicted protein [Nematostella vectensis]|eukprot:XP_001625384.1 predicted protein [Nematostella vectensis]
MPFHSEKQAQPSLIDREQSLVTTRKQHDWLPKFSQVKASERLRFSDFSDTFCGGIQYWNKRKEISLGKQSNKDTNMKLKGVPTVTQDPKCIKCGGFTNDRSKIMYHLRDMPGEEKCAFGREYCDVIGPCADCTLLQARHAITCRQSMEFPDLQVTPGSLVAPELAKSMLVFSETNIHGYHGRSFQETMTEYVEPGHSILQLPTLSPGTLRYMRRETGSRKQRRQALPTREKTIKKYIEVRLPKI